MAKKRARPCSLRGFWERARFCQPVMSETETTARPLFLPVRFWTRVWAGNGVWSSFKSIWVTGPEDAFFLKTKPGPADKSERCIFVSSRDLRPKRRAAARLARSTFWEPSTSIRAAGASMNIRRETPPSAATWVSPLSPRIPEGSETVVMSSKSLHCKRVLPGDAATGPDLNPGTPSRFSGPGWFYFEKIFFFSNKCADWVGLIKIILKSIRYHIFPPGFGRRGLPEFQIWVFGAVSSPHGVGEKQGPHHLVMPPVKKPGTFPAKPGGIVGNPT